MESFKGKFGGLNISEMLVVIFCLYFFFLLIIYVEGEGSGELLMFIMIQLSLLVLLGKLLDKDVKVFGFLMVKFKLDILLIKGKQVCVKGEVILFDNDVYIISIKICFKEVLGVVVFDNVSIDVINLIVCVFLQLVSFLFIGW